MFYYSLGNLLLSYFKEYSKRTTIYYIADKQQIKADIKKHGEQKTLSK